MTRGWHLAILWPSTNVTVHVPLDAVTEVEARSLARATWASTWSSAPEAKSDAVGSVIFYAGEVLS